MTDKIDKLAKLLPEGLTEDTIKAIDKMVTTAINEQVQKKVGGLVGKVIGFMNVHIDKIQKSALVQLEEGNEAYRRAKIMDAIFESVAIEVTPQDEDNALTNIVTESKHVDSHNETLVNELNEALESNTKRGLAIKALDSKVKKLTKDNEQLQEGFKTLEEQKKEPFKSSEKTVLMDEDGNVTAKGADAPEALKEGNVAHSDNPFLTKEIMSLMND